MPHTDSHFVPLVTRIGSRAFELKLSVGLFSKDNAHPAPVGHVVFDAADPGVLSVTGHKVTKIFSNDAANTVSWVSAAGNLCEGRLCFTNDGSEAVGTVTYRDGTHAVVTASPVDLDSVMAPPAYYAPDFVEIAAGDGIARSIPGSVHPKVAFAPSVAGNEGTYMTEFKTKRRPYGSGDNAWAPWYSLEYGYEDQSVGGRLVCVVNDVDISSSTVTTAGASTKEIVLTRTKGDPSNKDLDYTFRITLNVTTAEANQTFLGTWEDGGKTYDWKGEFRAAHTRPASTKPAETDKGPGGMTVTQLMAITSLKPTQKLVPVEVFDKDGNKTTEQRVVQEDMAQNESDRIFCKVVLASAPEDVRKVLAPEMAPLAPEELKIKAMGPKFLEYAGVVNVLSFLKKSSEVDQRQRDRIDGNKCDAFVRACATFGDPLPGVQDPVVAFGWNRTTDKATIERVQIEYRTVAEACYRLGYRLSVSDFQPFWKDPATAKEWYKLLAQHLVSPYHIQELQARIKTDPKKIPHDIFDWQNKLQILAEVAGDIGDAPTLSAIIEVLHGSVTFALLDGVMWSSDLKDSMLKLFTELDAVEKDTKIGKATKDALGHEITDYKELRQVLQDRGELTWSEFGKSLVEGLDEHVKHMERTPSVAELAESVADEGKAAPKAWTKLGLFRAAARGAVIAVGLWLLNDTLANGQSSLGLAEQISMYASLVDGSAKIVKIGGWIVDALSQRIAKSVGGAVAKVMRTRALAWVTAAQKWANNLASRAAGLVPNVVKGFFEKNWANIAEGIGLVFGFFVSVAALVASAFEFAKALREGTLEDKIFAGAQLTLAALATIAFSVQIVATMLQAEAIIALAGTIGMWLAGLGIVVAVVALIVTLTRPHPDPIKDIIDKYGPMYHLLK
ncbi:hypothetical protein PsYK624_044890 [Phanerochaete sordida]|uniref:Uncharacterized protein n=1 Tax=Phanerochaete sordida TaxID=48140 RepID=A0A9P3LAH3_9APHY|nr:hypothetical protein PsYK624_044890 [Phanerochaete sordida]